MPITIKRATTNEEFDQVFQLRHQVLVGDGYFRRRDDARVFDRFDAFPTSCLIYAEVEGQLVGTVRATIDSGIGTSVDEYFDFHSYGDPLRDRIAAGSHFYIAPAFRGAWRISALLMEMFHFWCVRQGCRYVKGVMNPRTVSLMQRLGYRPLGDARVSDKDQLPFVPVLLDTAQMSESLQTYVERQPQWQATETFHRWYGEADDRLPLAPQTLYLIQGQVTAPPRQLFSPGDFIPPQTALHACSSVELAQTVLMS
ncbi:MAG: GNAT family N-acetyltransferase [Blastocatellia bacterium]